MALQEYEVEINGVTLTMQMEEDTARARKLKPVRQTRANRPNRSGGKTVSADAVKPANKARTPRDRSRVADTDDK